MRKSRLLHSGIFLIVLIHLGALGFFLQLESAGESVSFAECLYRTIVLITTVNEPFPDLPDPGGLQQYTIFLLITGMGVVLYTVSALAAFLIELDLRSRAQVRKAKKMIDQLEGHIIVCGCGETGEVIIRELRRHGNTFVVIERNPERAQTIREREGNIHLIEGDATQDETLRQAGVERARGVITSLHSDMENLFVVITVHQLNPKAKIVARSIDPSTDQKLLRGGADFVVAPNTIGADRMVSAMVRPHVLSFMDRLLRDPESTNRIEEIEVQPGSSLDGRTIAESQIGAKTNIQVLATQKPGESARCNPLASARLEAGTLLVILGDKSGFETIQEMAGIESS